MFFHKIRQTPWYVFVIWTGWGAFIYTMLLSYNAASISVDYDTKKKLLFAFPQGWGFFTRNPREAQVDAYQLHQDAITLMTPPNASADNWFGLSRQGRVVSFELSEVLKNVGKSSWIQQRGEINNVPDVPGDTVKLRTRLKYFPPGDYVFHQYKPVPFAWANQGQEAHRPVVVCKIHIDETLASDTIDLTTLGYKTVD